MEFKDRLKMLRTEKKWTQTKLGSMLNYGYTAIANYESGRNQPSIPDLKKIASIFNVSMDYLLGVNDIRHPYELDEETAEFIKFRYRYSLLNEENKEKLMEYMEFLEQKQNTHGKNKTVSEKQDQSYGAQKLKPIIAKAAQKPVEYK